MTFRTCIFWVSISGEWVLHLWFFSDNAVCTWIVWRRIGWFGFSTGPSGHPLVRLKWDSIKMFYQASIQFHIKSHYVILRAKPSFITWTLIRKHHANTSSNTICLNSSSKFHVSNIWSSDPPQMREHLAVANEQAGEVPGSNESIGIKSWWRSKSNGWTWWLGHFFCYGKWKPKMVAWYICWEIKRYIYNYILVLILEKVSRKSFGTSQDFKMFSNHVPNISQNIYGDKLLLIFSLGMYSQFWLLFQVAYGLSTRWPGGPLFLALLVGHC